MAAGSAESWSGHDGSVTHLKSLRPADNRPIEEHLLDTSAYLQRINYDGPLSRNAETLRKLQVAHLCSVPFENLSIHAGEPIVLHEEALFEKIVLRRRGGFCYELNGLFAALLRNLGFDVAMLSASVMNTRGEFGPEFDHMTLLITLKERWLVDVGFGDSFREPLLLDSRGEQIQDSRSFRIDASDHDRLILLRRDKGGEWGIQYRFSLQPHVYADYVRMCHYHQTSPESHFTRGRVCSLMTETGRVTLSETRLITTRGEVRQERVLADEQEYTEVLRERFGIEMRA